MTITLTPNPLNPNNPMVALPTLTAKTVKGEITIPTRIGRMSDGLWRQFCSHTPRPRFVTDKTTGISKMTL